MNEPGQAQGQDIKTPSIQELINQMSQMRAELASLKGQAGNLKKSDSSALANATGIGISTRRNTLKRLGLALLGGAVTATALGAVPVAQARIVANPNTNSLTNRAGMLVLPPGAPVPINNPSSSNSTYGVIASADKTVALDLAGINGTNTGISGFGETGVFGKGTGTGIYGIGVTNGVFGRSDDTGVYGYGLSRGVYAVSNSIGIVASGGDRGVYGLGGPYGVYGIGSSFGIYGMCNNGVGGSAGVYGTGNNIGVYGVGYGTAGVGVYASAGTSQPYSAHFEKNIQVDATVVAGSKSFKIDHPLDPANKYLNHTSVESPDMKNIYDGVITLDERGQATVALPDWFEALNSDYRYQLTSLSVASPALHIAEEVSELQFKIAGGLPGQRVSWMVTGVRQDAWAKANRTPVEEDKSKDEKGLYLHPAAFGQPREKGVNFAMSKLAEAE